MAFLQAGVYWWHCHLATGNTKTTCTPWDAIVADLGGHKNSTAVVWGHFYVNVNSGKNVDFSNFIFYFFE